MEDMEPGRYKPGIFLAGHRVRLWLVNGRHIRVRQGKVLDPLAESDRGRCVEEALKLRINYAADIVNGEERVRTRQRRSETYRYSNIGRAEILGWGG